MSASNTGATMAATVEVYGIKCRRGVFKAFRDYLNVTYPPSRIVDGQVRDNRHRCNQFHQDTRLYGDYLYHQDRVMFDNLLHEAMTGTRIPEWNGTDYIQTDNCPLRHAGFDYKAWLP